MCSRTRAYVVCLRARACRALLPSLGASAGKPLGPARMRVLFLFLAPALGSRMLGRVPPPWPHNTPPPLLAQVRLRAALHRRGRRGGTQKPCTV